MLPSKTAHGTLQDLYSRQNPARVPQFVRGNSLEEDYASEPLQKAPAKHYPPWLQLEWLHASCNLFHLHDR